MIVKVNEENLQTAAEIYAESWQNTYCALYSESFVKRHTTARQKAYLEKAMQSGKQLYMLVKESPVGIISIKDSLIEDLFVLPAEQHKGYGTELLLFAIERCSGNPYLCVLNKNEKALSLYRKSGFHMTGKMHSFSNQLTELEMAI